MVSSVLDLKCIKIRDEAERQKREAVEKTVQKTTMSNIVKMRQLGVQFSEEQVQELLDYALAEVEKEY